MSHTDRLRRSPNAFRQLTGITPDAFDRLLAQPTPLHEAAETRRPGRGQRAYYSGKKKRHTIKCQVVTARRTKPPGPDVKPQRLRIAAVSESHPGSVHDKKVYDQARVVAPPDVRRTGDTAYIG